MTGERQESTYELHFGCGVVSGGCEVKVYFDSLKEVLAKQMQYKRDFRVCQKVGVTCSRRIASISEYLNET